MIIRSISCLVILSGASLFACASRRVPSTSTVSSPQDLRQLALDVAHTGMSQEQYTSIVQAFENSIVEMVERQAQNKKVSPASRRAFRAFFAEFMGKYSSYEAVCESVAEFYASRFTAAELKEIAAYHRTETYRKLMNLTPEMMQHEARRMQLVIEDHRDEIYAKIMQEVRDTQAN